MQNNCLSPPSNKNAFASTNIILNTMQLDAGRQGRDALSQGEGQSTIRGSKCNLEHKAVILLLTV